MKRNFIAFVIAIVVLGCTSKPEQVKLLVTQTPNVLDYEVSPENNKDKRGLMFSDQGAWFAYSFPEKNKMFGGFSGPFLMTQQNGVWASENLTKLNLRDVNNQALIDWKTDLMIQNAYASHLEQVHRNKKLEVKQQLVFASGHTALQKVEIKNLSNKAINFFPSYTGVLIEPSLSLTKQKNKIIINSTKSNAVGYVQMAHKIEELQLDSVSYNAVLKPVTLKSGASTVIELSQSFIFKEYQEAYTAKQPLFDTILHQRNREKSNQHQDLFNNLRIKFKDSIYKQVVEKSVLTLQNNWRIPAGELKHEGLFPSYHYKWFNGFWAWDSWKHAVGLSFYNTKLAKEQVKAMFTFQNADGFVADCVYRDTTIERHNYRDTKPPLAAWAVAKIVKKDRDIAFIKEIYPKLKSYHYWWYTKRDHDNDGLCEYGSTDGSLVAAKWESGMDNAIRFDNSKIVQNGEGAYSLDQESVDLNAYLFAEKNYLAQIAELIGLKNDVKQYEEEAEELKTKIQTQFYDEQDGWFYDTNLEGNKFIKGEGSEGWTALWAKAATPDQAKQVVKRMLDPNKFYTKVPFQTMSADHEKFNPLKGYWRGPNWLDQAYFGVKSLRNYGFNQEADEATKKIIYGAEGLIDRGTAIRENYHPLTGKGLNAQNFSWSAAHLIMLLMQE